MNERLSKLVKEWKVEGAPQQEGFNWTSSRGNWVKYFPKESKFISSLPDEVDRQLIRKLCNSKDCNIRQKFLAAMIWGYGDRGYGSYRVAKMLSQKNAESILAQVFLLAQSKKPQAAYLYLMQNRIKHLGPSYGSKFIAFCTPRETSAPIYDSFIALWIAQNAKNEFLDFSIGTLKWDDKIFARYCNWIDEHATYFECYPDDVELVLFRDAERQFSKSSNWGGK